MVYLGQKSSHPRSGTNVTPMSHQCHTKEMIPLKSFLVNLLLTTAWVTPAAVKVPA